MPIVSSSIYQCSFSNVRFLTKIEFPNVFLIVNEHEIVVKCSCRSRGAVTSATGSQQSPGEGSGSKAPEIFQLFYIVYIFLHLQDKKKCSKQKKLNVMKIESETSIRKLSFLSRLPEDIKIACPVSYISYSTFLTFLLLGD